MTPLHDSAVWFKRAQEIRAFALKLRTSKAREVLLRVADDYERLAKWVETKATHEDSVIAHLGSA